MFCPAILPLLGFINEVVLFAFQMACSGDDNGRYDPDDLSKAFVRFTIECNESKECVEKYSVVKKVGKKETSYFVHIDIISGSSSTVAYRINSYMLRHFYFDPRRFTNFLDEIFINADGTPGNPSLREMREVMQVSSTYYELWKVKSDFDLAAFYNHFAGGDFNNLCIRVTQLFGDGEYTLTRRQY